MSVVRTFGRMAIPWSTILQLGKSDFQNSWSSVCPETPLSDRNMNWNSWRNLFLFYAIQTPSGQFEWISSTGNTGTCWVVPSLHHRRDLPACVASFYRRICERESGMLLGRKNCLLPDGPCPPPPTSSDMSSESNCRIRSSYDTSFAILLPRRNCRSCRHLR